MQKMFRPMLYPGKLPKGLGKRYPSIARPLSDTKSSFQTVIIDYYTRWAEVYTINTITDFENVDA